MTSDPPRRSSDVLIIGAGLIGMSCAAAAADRGFTVHLVGEQLPGAASLAAAGMLAPSIEREEDSASRFAVAARDRYPQYIEWLREASGIDVPLNREGIIQVALSEAGLRGLRRSMASGAEWLDATELARLEPALAHGLGGVYHALDGAVDNVALYDALRVAVERNPRIAISLDVVVQLEFGKSVVVHVRSGSRLTVPRVVLAAGAWSGSVAGLPRAIPVEPVRGQMIAYAGVELNRVVYGPTGYVVPRTSRTLVGATTERAGFDPSTTGEGSARLETTAREILPRLGRVAPAETWAGLRPMSRDLQPILGLDPDEPRLVYATGHSRNGVLMAPLTGDCIAAVLGGEPLPVDIEPFSIVRFDYSTDAGVAQPSTAR